MMNGPDDFPCLPSAATCMGVPVLAAMLCLSCFAAADPPASGPATMAIDDFAYASDAAASEAWRPMKGTSDVAVTTIDGRKALVMPCNFKGTDIERASWDRAVKLDLTGAKAIRFQFQCADPTPVGHFALYLHAGPTLNAGGWYRTSFGPTAKSGWGTVTIAKTDFDIEDAPTGWSKIDAIRISAWRGAGQDTSFALADFRAVMVDEVRQPAPVVLVRGESVAATAKGELGSVCTYAGNVARMLDDLGIGYILISDLDLTAERLAGRKLVILPFNPQVGDVQVKVVEEFIKGGGKLLAFYSLPERLESVIGIKSGKSIGDKPRGYFASIRPVKDSPIKDMPSAAEQASWNIHQFLPVDGRSRVGAMWCDKDGKDTGASAIVAGDNAVVMSHVLLTDDIANKRMLLIAMAGHLVPELWKQAAEASVARIGRVGPHKDIRDLHEILRSQPKPPVEDRSGNDRQPELQLMCASAQAQTYVGNMAIANNEYVKAIKAAQIATREVVNGWCVLEKPLAGEHRAFWCHNALGLPPKSWDESIKLLADNGFTAILPNMCWGGAAYYESEVLPFAADVNEKDDQVALCLAACRKYGVQCHVWKVNWNMGWRTPKEFMEKMRKDGRMQVGPDGKPIDRWLCPSSPGNQKLEIDSMVELAAKYDLDGIHFDYIRYPGPQGCFCSNCRERFEKVLAHKVANWPQDVTRPGADRDKWLQFRCDNITAVVAAVSEQARKARPKIKISAAVFPNYPADRDSVGQDWPLWCQKGYLDFVCPMDYTSSTAQFSGWVERQVKLAGKVPCYPGIGYSVWQGKGDIFTLFDQINVTRAAKTGGFTIFNYDDVSAKDAVPLCGMGITRKEAK
ncbi:MAG: glycoside hydrolase family 10 protein [Phycisphaerae bacterium]